MSDFPKWFRPVTVVALLWNLIGCAAFVADAMLTPEDIAKLDAAQQAMYAARPAWSVAATALAVFAGALGCVGLLARKRWAVLMFWLSLAGVIAQDASLLMLASASGGIDPTAMVLQGVVLVVAILLVLLGRRAARSGWIA